MRTNDVPFIDRYVARGHADSVAHSDRFAGWWTRGGWMFHSSMGDGFANWAAGVLPRAVDNDEE